MRRLSLTPDLVALTRREVLDPGPDPDLVYHTEADYDAAVDAALAHHPAGEDVWIFAFGSLIWRPEVEHTQERHGTAHGWHRSFCIHINRWRATREEPGLMMALDRGGQCRGMLFRLPAEGARDQIGRLFRREMSVKPPNNQPRWLKVATTDGPVRAIGFVMNRKSRFYAGGLPEEVVAERLARACGHWGSGAEYLYNTITHLAARGIVDRNLWRLQERVAARILERHAPGRPGPDAATS